jgi:hypothetical protein
VKPTGVLNVKFKKLFILVTVNHLAELVCISVGALRHNCNKRRRNLVELIFLSISRAKIMDQSLETQQSKLDMGGGSNIEFCLVCGDRASGK